MNDSQILATHLDLILDRQDRILFTYKAHEKAADRIERYEKIRKWVSILLTTVSATAFVVSLVGLLVSEQVANLVVSFIALLATGTSMVSDTFDFKEDSRQHTLAGVNLREIFQDYESLKTDLKTEKVTVEAYISQRDLIAKKETKLLRTLPRTTAKDYKKASKALGRHEKVSTYQNNVSKLEES